MAEFRPFERRRLRRGIAYSLVEFRKKYDLNDKAAEDLFVRFGPSSVELHMLMASKCRSPTFNEITKDMPFR